MTRLLALLLTAAAAFAADSPPFSRRVWQTTDGLPEDFAQSIAQTPDGYLWIGTSAGLVRFDGVRFTVFDSRTESAIRDDSIYSLTTTRDGALWAGAEGGGLIRYRAGSFRAFGAAEGLANGFVRVIFEDRTGTLWVGTDSGLFRMDGESLSRVDNRDGMPGISVHSICQDRRGRLLVGGVGLLVLDGKRFEYYRSAESMADNSIRAIRETADGAVWIGTITGLRRLAAGVDGNPFSAPKLIRDNNVGFLAESRSGALWIGAYGQGAMRYRDGGFERFNAPSFLPHDNVLWIFEDAENDIWIGTQGGLLRLSPSAVTTITTSDGAPQSINAIYRDPRGPLYATALNGRLFEVADDALRPAGIARPARIRNTFRDSTGALWMGTDGQGAIRIAPAGGERRFTTRDGLVNDFVRAFAEDRDGGIWIGTDGGLSRWHGGVFRSFNIQHGLVYNSIRALQPDPGGAVWIATDGGLSRFENGRFAADPVLERFRGVKLWALYRDAEGGLWIGGHGAGLYLVKNGSFSQWTTRNGLPTDKIHFIAESADGNLWLSGPGAVFSTSRAGLEKRAEPLALRVYGPADGLTTAQMNGGVQPAGALTPAGELWLPSAKGVVHIRPGAPASGAAVPVLIEEAFADDRPAPLAGGLRVGPGAGKLEIHYTAIRLRAPERTRFKYWMENFDPVWTDAGQRRIAYYTNMPPGAYRFHVVAYEVNDPARASERVIEVEWRPHFYRTAWFTAVLILAAAAVAWGAYRLHVRNLRKRFDAVLEERNRLAREMHDTLIQGCVGVSTLLEAASSAQQVSPEIADSLLERARQEVRATVDEARLAVWNLRQNVSNGNNVVPAASQLTERISSESGIPAEFKVTGTPVSLDAESAQSLLMLIREALQNAVRHAQPAHLSVAVAFDHHALTVEIADDGRGFDPDAAPSTPAGHYGLTGMRERVANLGGKLHLASAPGKGTTVRLTVPLRLGR